MSKKSVKLTDENIRKFAFWFGGKKNLTPEDLANIRLQAKRTGDLKEAVRICKKGGSTTHTG